MNVHDSTPVVVGVGQHCPKVFDPKLPCAPVDLVAEAARKALADSGQAERLRQAIDTVVFFKLFVDMGFAASPLGRSTKPPRSLAQRLGIDPPNAIYSAVGGNLPQKMLNDYAEAVVRGGVKAVLLAGGESLRTSAEALRAGIKLDWNEDPPGEMVDLGGGDDLVDMEYEFPHGVGLPAWSYPLFENAIRGRKGHTVPQHMKALGELWAGLNRIALRNPLAAAPSTKTAVELSTPSPDNRWIAFPYTRVMNANDRVDEAAAVILTSAGTARALGIDASRWVFLRGCGDARARLRTLDHIDYHSSPALALCGRRALAQAGIGIDRIDFFDIYSCFPSAVELGRDALGIAEDDPRPLTVTGGLSFFGGPGNAYVLHAIAETVEWLRRGRGKYGLVTGNGGFMSKQSVGIYSTEPPQGEWRREDPARYQSELDALVAPRVERMPEGPARVETYTVICEKGVPVRGVVIGRLLADEARFVANTPTDRPELLRWLMDADPLNALGTVENRDGRNWFVPNEAAA